MKVLVIEVAGLGFAGLLVDERLSNLRHLLAAGCFGQLASRGGLAHHSRAEHVAVAGDPPGDIRHVLLRPANWAAFDEELGVLLGEMVEGSALLVHSRAGDPDGFFVIAGDLVPPLGVVEGIGFDDIAPAILRLVGFTTGPESPLSRLLVTEPVPCPSDEEAEAIIQERLRGLGYIA